MRYHRETHFKHFAIFSTWLQASAARVKTATRLQGATLLKDLNPCASSLAQGNTFYWDSLAQFPKPVEAKLCGARRAHPAPLATMMLGSRGVAANTTRSCHASRKPRALKLGFVATQESFADIGTASWKPRWRLALSC